MSGTSFTSYQGVIQESPYLDEKPYEGDLVRHGQSRFIPVPLIGDLQKRVGLSRNMENKLAVQQTTQVWDTGHRFPGRLVGGSTTWVACRMAPASTTLEYVESPSSLSWESLRR